MCNGNQRPLFDSRSFGDRQSPNDNPLLMVDQRGRLALAETEARIERARAREAELSRRLAEMQRFVSVMEILESYLKRRLNESLL